MEKEFMIYESPDKGNTIYRRKPGSAERELIKKQPDKQHKNRNRYIEQIKRTYTAKIYSYHNAVS